jgi:uncharacterized protein with ParB-like and HNH nuclease domain
MYTGTHSMKVIFEKDQRLVVPLFQRPYVWSKEHQWEPLWEDIRNVAERNLRNDTAKPHFMGAVVLDQIRQPIGRVDSRLVIDGQQRLTTIQLFIEAFADICDEVGQSNYHKALLKLTRNDNPLSEDENEIYKIWPTNSDQDHFKKVMSATSAADLRKIYKVNLKAPSIGNAIADCYLFFNFEISGWLSAEKDGITGRVEALYKTVCEYLRMVVIELDKDDDAQLIFETLNARGTPLLPSDLVKNFLFHKAEIEGEKLDSLYAKYWKHFDDQSQYWRKEVGIGHAKRARIDMFLQHYLTLKTRDEVPSGHIYTTYRQFVLNNKYSKAKEQLQELQKYADLYKKINNLPRDTRIGISLLWLDIIGVTTVYPFLLELFSRYEADDLEIERTLIYVESYLVRRMVCNLTTRGYNRTFLELLSVFSDDSGLVSKRVFDTLSAYDAESNRWPGELEFRQSWVDRPLYNLLRQQRLSLILESLERKLHTKFTEDIQFNKKLTIEHIMPQEWRKNWPFTTSDNLDELEINRNRLIHTIGNLTLLNDKLNPSISNGDWETKKKGIKNHSILLLNKQLEDYSSWSEKGIDTRSQDLFELAMQIWPTPDEARRSTEIVLPDLKSIDGSEENPEDAGNSEESQTRDTSRYDITAYGITVTNQPKRRCMLHAIKSLCDHGAMAEKISELIFWRSANTFFIVQGSCSSEEFIKRAVEQQEASGKNFDPGRWFCDDDHLILQEGNTYAFSRMWGIRWKQALKILNDYYPDAEIVVSKSQNTDLIQEYRPNQQATLHKFLVDLVQHEPGLILDQSPKSHVRFWISDLDTTFLKQGQGWTNTGRILLFQFNNFDDRLWLYLVLGPGPVEIRQKLHDIAHAHKPPFKPMYRALNKKWNVIYEQQIFSPANYSGTTIEEKEAEIRKKWKQFLENDLPQIQSILKSQD